MSTLAIRGSEASESEASERLASPSRGAQLTRYADLVLLALALPLFLVAGWPMLGYAVAALAWLAQHAIQLAAESRSRRALAEGDRRMALGAVAGATLGRVWLVALAILLVGGLAEREDGLAAALLSVALVTASLAGRGIAQLLAPEQTPLPREASR